MRKLVRLVGAAPLAGKAAIHPTMFSVYLSTTKKKRCFAYVRLLLLIIIMIFGHGYQVLLGLYVMSYAGVLWMQIAGVIYAAVNATVIVTHIYYVYMATRVLMSGRYPKRQRSAPELSDRSIVTSMCFTFTCQIIFLIIAASVIA